MRVAQPKAVLSAFPADRVINVRRSWSVAIASPRRCRSRRRGSGSLAYCGPRPARALCYAALLRRTVAVARDPLGVLRLPVVADEVVGRPIPWVRRADVHHELAELVPIGGVLPLLGALVAPGVVLLAYVRVLLHELSECRHVSPLSGALHRISRAFIESQRPRCGPIRGETAPCRSTPEPACSQAARRWS